MNGDCSSDGDPLSNLHRTARNVDHIEKRKGLLRQTRSLFFTMN